MVDALQHFFNCLLGDEVFDGEFAHGDGTLHHDAVDEAVFYAFDGVGQIVKAIDSDFAFAVAKLLLDQNLGHSRAANLAHPEDAGEARVAAQDGMRDSVQLAERLDDVLACRGNVRSNFARPPGSGFSMDAPPKVMPP